MTGDEPRGTKGRRKKKSGFILPVFLCARERRLGTRQAPDGALKKEEIVAKAAQPHTVKPR